MEEKMWSINVFAKDKNGNYSKDMYTLNYKWSYSDENIALKSFNKIPNSDTQETLCELMEYNFNTKELKLIAEKYSNIFASQFIIPGKYQHDI